MVIEHNRVSMAPGLVRNLRTKIIPNSRQSLIDHMTKTGSVAKGKNRQSERTNMGSDKANKGLPITDGSCIGTEITNPTSEGNLPNVQSTQTLQKEMTFMPSIQSPQTQQKEMTLEGTQQNESTLDPPAHQENQNPESQEAITDKASAPKRTRGQTMGKGIMKAFGATGKKMKIDVDPLIGRPKSREQSAKLSSQIGVVARDVLSVPKKWKEMADDKFLEPGIDHIKIHLDVNLDVPGVRHCLVDRIKSTSRQMRYRMHKHFKKYATLQEAKDNKPPFCASKENWEELCDYFSSAKFKHQSLANTVNRQLLRTPHISGRTPFSTLQHEIAEKYVNGDDNEAANGDAGDVIEFYKLTHFTDKHGWSTEEAKENWELMVSRREKYIGEGAEKTNHEIVHEVLGQRSTFLKGLGYQTSRLNKRIYASANHLENELLQKELQETREKLVASESQVSELKETVNGMKNTMDQQAANIEKIMAFMGTN